MCPPIDKSRIGYLEIDDKLWQDWNEEGDYNLLVMPNNSNIFKYLGQDYHTWRTDTVRHYDSLPREVNYKRERRKT